MKLKALVIQLLANTGHMLFLIRLLLVPMNKIKQQLLYARYLSQALSFYTLYEPY
jgi:hypothetical protein